MKTVLFIMLFWSTTAMGVGINVVATGPSSTGGLGGAGNNAGLCPSIMGFAGNPATLSLVYEDYAEMSDAVILPKYTLKDRFGTHRSQHNDWYLVPTIGAAKEFNENMVGGLFLTVPYAQAAKFEGETESSLNVIDLSPALALRLSDRVSIGLSLNFGYIQLKDVRPKFGLKTNTEADGLSWPGATLGVRWQVSDRFTVGASYMTEQKFKLHGSTQMSLGPFGFEDELITYFTSPDRFGAGMTYRINERLTFAFDYNRFTCEVNDMAMDFKRLPTIIQPMGLGNNGSVHIGILYQVNKRLSWSSGWGYQTNGFKDENLSQSTPDVSGWNVNVGMVYKTSCRYGDLDLGAYVIRGVGHNKGGTILNPIEIKGESWIFGLGGGLKF